MTRKLLPLIVLVGIGATGPVLAQGTNPFIGEVETFAFGYCPTGWAPLNGQLLPIAQNPVLYNLVGTTYGGDGQTTFALPIVRPIYTATGQTLTQCISLVGVYPSQN